MKISFIGCKDSSMGIFKELALELSKKISGLELEERFVPVLEDLPEVAYEESQKSDFIFVFALTDEKEKIEPMKEKLIDVELKTGTRILKEIDDDAFSSMEEEQYIQEKDLLVEHYAEIITDILFNELSFEPEDRDFGL